VDGVVSFGADRSPPAMIQHTLGMERLRTAALAWHPGGGGVCGALDIAANAVRSGQAETVALFRSLCQTEDDRYGRHKPDRPFVNFNAPFGVFAPATHAALLLRRHMHLYGTSPASLGRIAVQTRANAARNPRALMGRVPMDMDAYFASRLISDPLRLLDCCLETDGACAVLVTTQERAADCAKASVAILATAVGSERWWGAGAFGGHNMPDDLYATGNAATVAKDLFARAGLQPRDVDVAQIYDAFTAMVLFALEDYGFCERGAGGAFIDSGATAWPDGSVPVNTSGGNLSEAYIHGLNLVVEAVRQVRGESAAQVNGAQVSFVCGATIEGPTSAALLGAA
jgi:acetyl-CoA acetyltransferase